jgi:septum formation protein
MIPQLILASASPARRRLLKSAGIDAIVRPSTFNESQIQIDDPDQLVQTLAQHKAATIANSLQTEPTSPRLVLGCDSVLSIQGKIHGKPANPQQAWQRWQQMRGQVGDLYTGHALIHLFGSSEPPPVLVKTQITRVHFARPSDREIEDYIATGEPLHCAGGFALEGRGGLFVEKLEGCHSNVIGLSLPLLRQMLQELGYEVSQFWRSS